MAGKIKRSKVAMFMNTATSGSDPSWSLIGEGVTEQTISYNPATSEEVYIHQDSGSTDVEAYKPTIPTPCTAIKGDEVFEFVDNLRINRAVLADAETDIVIVYMYKDKTTDSYPAEKNRVSIQIDDFGGEGGGGVKINYTINLKGDPIKGSFSPGTKVFTAA